MSWPQPIITHISNQGKVCIMGAQVLHHVLWPHEFVYMLDGQPDVYENLSVLLFISVYVKVMDAEKPAIRALMATHL